MSPDQGEAGKMAHDALEKRSEAVQRLLKRPLPASPHTLPPSIAPAAYTYTNDASKRPRTRPPSPCPDVPATSAPKAPPFTQQHSRMRSRDSFEVVPAVQPTSQTTLQSFLTHRRQSGHSLDSMGAILNPLTCWKTGPATPAVELSKASASPADRVRATEKASNMMRASFASDLAEEPMAAVPKKDVSKPSRPDKGWATDSPSKEAAPKKNKDTEPKRKAGRKDAGTATTKGDEEAKPVKPKRTRDAKLRCGIKDAKGEIHEPEDGWYPKNDMMPIDPEAILPKGLQQAVAQETQILSLLFDHKPDEPVPARWILLHSPFHPSIPGKGWSLETIGGPVARLWRLRMLMQGEDNGLATNVKKMDDRTIIVLDYAGVACSELKTVLQRPLQEVSDILFYIAVKYLRADRTTPKRFNYARAWILTKRYAECLADRVPQPSTDEFPWRTVELEMYVVICAAVLRDSELVSTLRYYLNFFYDLSPKGEAALDFASGVLIHARFDRIKTNSCCDSGDSDLKNTRLLLQEDARIIALRKTYLALPILGRHFLPERSDTPVLVHHPWIWLWAEKGFHSIPSNDYQPSTTTLPLDVRRPIDDHHPPEAANHESLSSNLRPKNHPAIGLQRQIQGGPTVPISVARPRRIPVEPQEAVRDAQPAPAVERTNQAMWVDVKCLPADTAQSENTTHDQRAAGLPLIPTAPPVAHHIPYRPPPSTSAPRHVQYGFHPDPRAHPRSTHIEVPSGESSRSVSAERPRHAPHTSISTISSVHPTPVLSDSSKFSDLPLMGQPSRDVSCATLAEGMQRLFAQDEPVGETQDGIHRGRDGVRLVGWNEYERRNSDSGEEPIYMGMIPTSEKQEQMQLGCEERPKPPGLGLEDVDMMEGKGPGAPTLATATLRPAPREPPKMPPGMTQANRPPTIWRSQTRAPPVGASRPVRKRSASFSSIPGPLPPIVAPRSASHSRMNFIMDTSPMSSRPGRQGEQSQGFELEGDVEREEASEDEAAEGESE